MNDAMSAAVQAYMAGDKAATLTLVRKDGHKYNVTIHEMYDIYTITDLEQKALNSCRSPIVDVGAGLGRHSVKLQEMGFDVCALDIDPSVNETLMERGICKIHIGDARHFDYSGFGSILLLNNAIGMFGGYHQAEEFLRHISQTATPGCRVIIHSTDIGDAIDKITTQYRNENINLGLPPGHAIYKIKFKDHASEPFPWYYPTREETKRLARASGLQAEALIYGEAGQFIFLASCPGS